jgi:hypothetical protein
MLQSCQLHTILMQKEQRHAYTDAEGAAACIISALASTYALQHAPLVLLALQKFYMVTID